MGKALKKLGKGKIQFFFFFFLQSPVFSPSGSLPSGAQARGQPRWGDTLTLSAAGREGASKQAGQSSGEQSVPLSTREAEQEAGGHHTYICSQWGRLLSLNLPDPIPSRVAVFQKSMDLMGPHKSGWQQMEAPTAPLLCQLQNWGSGRHEAQRRALSASMAPCEGERAAQVLRKAAPHTSLH